MLADLTTHLPPPPRVVRRRVGSGCALWFIRLFILPHTLIGAFLLLAGPAHLYVHLLGKQVTAVVDRSNITTSKKGGRSYRVFYHYGVDGYRFNEETSASIDEPARAAAGFKFNGVAAEVAGHALFIPRDKSMLADVLPLLFMALFWNGILSLFLYAAWIEPLRQRWLYKYGETTTASVIGREVKRGKGTTYLLKYAFTTPEGFRAIGKGGVTRFTYDQTPDGAPITVLYSAQCPWWNRPYDGGDFVVLGPRLG